jgi:hypothetical protein
MVDTDAAQKYASRTLSDHGISVTVRGQVGDPATEPLIGQIW